MLLVILSAIFGTMQIFFIATRYDFAYFPYSSHQNNLQKMKQKAVKKSVSVPAELWDFVVKLADKQGHSKPSAVIHQALRSMERNFKRRKEFAK